LVNKSSKFTDFKDKILDLVAQLIMHLNPVKEKAEPKAKAAPKAKAKAKAKVKVAKPATVPEAK